MPNVFLGKNYWFSGNGNRFVVCDSAKEGKVQIYDLEKLDRIIELLYEHSD